MLNVSALLRELILHACKLSKLSRKHTDHKAIIEIIVDQLQAAPAVPLQLPHPSDPRALKVVQRLLEDPAEPRTLKGLCADCGASKRTIERIFRLETKMTFGRWRQQLRLLHALSASLPVRRLPQPRWTRGMPARARSSPCSESNLARRRRAILETVERVLGGRGLPDTGNFRYLSISMSE